MQGRGRRVQVRFLNAIFIYTTRGFRSGFRGGFGVETGSIPGSESGWFRPQFRGGFGVGIGSVSGSESGSELGSIPGWFPGSKRARFRGGFRVGIELDSGSVSGSESASIGIDPDRSGGVSGGVRRGVRSVDPGCPIDRVEVSTRRVEVSTRARVEVSTRVVTSTSTRVDVVVVSIASRARVEVSTRTRSNRSSRRRLESTSPNFVYRRVRFDTRVDTTRESVRSRARFARREPNRPKHFHTSMSSLFVSTSLARSRHNFCSTKVSRDRTHVAQLRHASKRKHVSNRSVLTPFRFDVVNKVVHTTLLTSSNFISTRARDANTNTRVRHHSNRVTRLACCRSRFAHATRCCTPRLDSITSRERVALRCHSLATHFACLNLSAATHTHTNFLLQQKKKLCEHKKVGLNFSQLFCETRKRG
jgi:hypothetical protein